MQIRTFATGVAALCATALLTAGLLAQTTPGTQPAPKPAAPKPAQPAQPGTAAPKPAQPATGQPPAMSPEQAQMMQAWMKYAATGEAHARLAKKEGKWNVHGKMWMAPGSEPEEIDGTSTYKMILDGHYLEEVVVGAAPDPMTGTIFGGRSWIAYDNLTKQVVSTWIDNMGTGIVRYTGTPSADWSTITFTGESPDFIAGKYKTVKSVERKVSDDQFVVTMYDTTPDGKEYQSMVLTYTRGTGTPAAPGMAPSAKPAAPGTGTPGTAAPSSTPKKP